MRGLHERLCSYFSASRRFSATPIAALCCRSQTRSSNYVFIVAAKCVPYQAKPLGSAYR